MIMSLKQKKIKIIKPRIKLNHNITTFVVFSQGMMPKHDNLMQIEVDVST